METEAELLDIFGVYYVKETKVKAQYLLAVQIKSSTTVAALHMCLSPFRLSCRL